MAALPAFFQEAVKIVSRRRLNALHSATTDVPMAITPDSAIKPTSYWTGGNTRMAAMPVWCIAAMANPNSELPERSLPRLKVPRLVTYRANPDAATAIRRDRPVIGTSYDTVIGMRNESMPMKCIDQMPDPMAAAPPNNQRGSDLCPWEATTLDVKSGAT